MRILLGICQSCVLVALMALSGCAGGEDRATRGSTSGWRGTVTTEGDITTVVNESGYVWGDVEIREALSIGVPVGTDPYMFGSVPAVAVDEQRTYVADSQLSIVRAYDAETGTHLLDIGREGEGPGELNMPETMAVGPNGRLYVQDRRRVTVFEPDGRFVETWPYRGGPYSGGGRDMVIGNDGTAYIPSRWTAGDQRETGYIVLSTDGVEIGRIAADPRDRTDWELTANNAISVTVPYSGGPHLAVLPGGEIVRGDSGAYRIELERPDGTILAIERAIELPPVPDDQEQWIVDYWTHEMRRQYDPGWTWNGRPVPEHKPAFVDIFGDRHGRVWLRRIVGTERDPTCDPMEGGFTSRNGFECWDDVHAFDVFNAETGQLLGQVPIPQSAIDLQQPAFNRDAMFLVVQDDVGTIMVKRYRLVLPGEG